mmetsp:Transcript_8821/g.16859  ORF Transcript_8821/g.16859 Transcript_8821/m.16859 type:complete len:415 (-) Transcript_8821:168-1412(-)
MSVDHHGEFLYCGTGRDGVGTFLDQISGMQTNNVNSHNLASVLVEQNLGHTGTFAFSEGLTVGTEGSLRFSQCPSFGGGPFLALLFRGSDHGNFGVCEASGRDGVVVHNMGSADNVFYGRNTLSRSGMCQHHLSVGVTNAVKVRNDRSTFSVTRQDFHLLGNGNKTTVGFNTHGVKSHASRIGDTSGGDHASIHFDSFDVFLGLGVDHLNSDGLFSWNTWNDLRGKDRGTVVNRTITDQKTLGLLGNLTIKRRHDVIKCLDEGNFRSQGCVDVGEFQTNIPRTDDGDPFRYVGELERTIGSTNSLLVNGDTRRDKGNATRGQDNILRSVHFSRDRILDFMRFACQNTLAFNDRHTQTFERGLQISLDSVGQVLGMGRNALPVVFDRSFDLDPHTRQMVSVSHFANTSRSRQESL